jgi:hypothetical protein
MAPALTSSLTAPRPLAAQSARRPCSTLKILARTSITLHVPIKREAAQGMDRVTSFQGENAI